KELLVSNGAMVWYVLILNDVQIINKKYEKYTLEIVVGFCFLTNIGSSYKPAIDYKFSSHHQELIPALNQTLGLEAQQRYSTGYIQCMHEVHNMLLTCDWMDKTLGSRLLNHLLKSLPRSNHDLSRPKHRHDGSVLTSQGIPTTPLRSGPIVGRQHQKGESVGQVPERQERPAIHTSSLGMLEMWRPW
uniref:Orange domain-containing protein n=1 Tax=Fundulus heteroclitus TaxID=8078 RepID=A0A3Q2P270_FUNHE